MATILFYSLFFPYLDNFFIVISDQKQEWQFTKEFDNPYRDLCIALMIKKSNLAILLTS